MIYKFPLASIQTNNDGSKEHTKTRAKETDSKEVDEALGAWDDDWGDWVGARGTAMGAEVGAEAGTDTGSAVGDSTGESTGAATGELVGGTTGGAVGGSTVGGSMGAGGSTISTVAELVIGLLRVNLINCCMRALAKLWEGQLVGAQ